jgi:hypothetical protein
MCRLNVVLALAAAILASALSLEANAQDLKATVPACLPSATLDQFSKAFDDALSGPGDKDRTCLHQLLLPDARLVMMVRVAEGILAPHSLTVAEFINAVSERGSMPFFGRQIKSRTESYGHIAHIWSTYEITTGPKGAATSRGITSAQIIFDGKNWRIAEVLWQPERPENPVPAHYLP